MTIDNFEPVYSLSKDSQGYYWTAPLEAPRHCSTIHESKLECSPVEWASMRYKEYLEHRNTSRQLLEAPRSS